MVDPTDLQGWLFATCEQDLDQKIYSVAMEAYFEFSK